jgi:simple sugar transport system permease protein
MPMSAGSLNVSDTGRVIGERRPQKTGVAGLLARPEAGTILATVCVFVFFSIFADKFLTDRIMSNVFLLSAELGIIAIGVTMLMVAGEFDLSVGSVFGLGAGVAIVTLNAGIPGPAAMAIVLVVAALIGALNGFLVTRLRVHSLIITLGGLMFFRAIVLAITGGFPLRLTEPEPFLSIFSFWLWGVPGTFFWLIGLVVVFAFVLNNTKLGNWVFATGGARDAAREMGVPTSRVKIMMFMIASMLAAFAGTVQMARFSSIDALRGDGLELEAVLAVVVGGASLNGGYGSVVGAALGVIMLAMIKQGLILMGIDAYWYRAGIGAVLILAAVLNQHVRERAGQ